MSLLLTAAALVAAGLATAGAVGGLQRMRAASLSLAADRTWWLERFGEAGAQLSVDGAAVLFPYGARQVLLRADAGDVGRLADRDAPVPPPGAMFCVSIPMPTLARLHFKLIREWEPLTPTVWPGGAFVEPELQAALRDQQGLFRAMRSLLEAQPIRGLWLDGRGVLHVFVDGEARQGERFDALWEALTGTIEACDAAADALAARALLVRGEPGGVSLPARAALSSGAARVEGAPVAVPLAIEPRERD